MSILPRIWNDLLNLFFPRTCLTCGSPLMESEEQICLKCLCDLPYTNFHKSIDNRVSQLFYWCPSFQKATAFFFYEKGGHVQRLIHELKYHDNPEIGRLLGRLAAKNIQAESPFFESVDLLLPIPLHPKRQRKRGYNQAEKIAQGIHEITHLPIDTKSVIRIIGNESQTHKQPYERAQNVCSIFKIQDMESLRDRHVLLIDDVITTGSTLNSLCQTLVEVPGIRFSIFSLSTV